MHKINMFLRSTVENLHRVILSYSKYNIQELCVLYQEFLQMLRIKTNLFVTAPEIQFLIFTKAF